MKIVNREEFLKLSAGVLFSKYKPYVFGPLQIKGDSWGQDFLTMSLNDLVYSENFDDRIKTLDLAETTGCSINLDFEGSYIRDGLYEEEELFAIWEPKDIWQLIDTLKKECLKLPERIEDDTEE